MPVRAELVIKGGSKGPGEGRLLAETAKVEKFQEERYPALAAHLKNDTFFRRDKPLT